MLDETDKLEIINEIKSKFTLNDNGDFRSTELARFLNVSEDRLIKNASINRVFGAYKYGAEWRFRREEILFRRAMGMNILKDKNIDK